MGAGTAFEIAVLNHDVFIMLISLQPRACFQKKKKKKNAIIVYIYLAGIKP
jgi:hypothetical protein